MAESNAVRVDRAIEKHYRVKEVAKLWGLSLTTITEIFRNEPDVLRVKGLRKTTMSIPESVLTRVHQTRSRGFLAEFQSGDRSVQKTLVRRKKRSVVPFRGLDASVSE